MEKMVESASHDSVNRFLLRENYTAQDLFNKVKGDLILEGGTLSGDDSLLDKPHSTPGKAGWFHVSQRKT